MIEALSRRRGWLTGLLALYFLVNIALRLALPSSLELDEGQQLFLAQWLAVGYDSQPPFYNWLQYGVVQLLGDTVLALSLLKNAMLFACYGLVGMMAARIIRNPVLVVIAVLGLLTVPQIVFEAQRDLTHTVAVLFAACLFVYALVATLQQPTAGHYALTGLAIGLGVIAKYNFVLLPVAAFVAVLLDPVFRRRLFDMRLVLTAVIAIAIVTPHGLWFIEHLRTATDRTLGKLMQDGDDGRLDQIGDGLISLAQALIAFSVVTIGVFAAVFGRQLRAAWRTQSSWSRLIGRMLLILVAALVLLVLIGGASHIKDRWLTPFFFLLPVYLALKIDLLDQPLGSAPKHFGRIAVLLMIVVPLVLFARVPAARLTGDYKKINVPYQPAIEAILATGRHRPTLIATTELQMAGNLRLNAPGIPVMIPGYEAFQQPVTFDAEHPLLMVWRDKGQADAPLEPLLQGWHDAYIRAATGASADPIEAHDIALPYHYGRPGDLYHVRYAWVYPPAR
ncbi:dolichyl-phosphate-mannose-protein mannosyltransferase [Rhizobium sp. PP-F2F-G38]|nr:dolichyl-phosphate-mannose-protein mannosyltransferase [Rhizobium sp. PP-WC-1G-195]PYE98769.1 dolichyl-phosphate-mannose-protein mannosyltransferase [Rhizobium sp. PP-F2F-G38]TCQ11540.1 dolichyl-phosphate-mannose-protein mannosyltransferase [Rhizobium sp. PP-F2F-G36]